MMQVDVAFDWYFTMFKLASVYVSSTDDLEYLQDSVEGH